MIIDSIEKNSTICFFGDSITACGIWQNEIMSYLVENFNEKRIKLYNCGIAGDTASGGIKRIYKDCLCYNPDYVVLMYAMNDIGRNFYLNDGQENIIKRRECMENYKNNMEALAKTIKSTGAKLILCTPTISGYIPKDKEDVPNVIPVLEECAAFIKTLTKKYDDYLIDFNSKMWEYVDQQEQVIEDDFVHPTVYGYHIMAQIFMQEMGIKKDIDLREYVEQNPKNKIRYEAEEYVVHARFCEYSMNWFGVVSENMTIEERKKWVKEFVDTKNTWQWYPNYANHYIESADNREKYLGELIRLTNEIYL